jgi:hypothetical protein
VFGEPDVWRLTLVTGDVALVRRDGDGRLVARLAPHATGRMSGYRTQRSGGSLYLFPTIAVPYLAGGRLDRELFNLTRMIDSGSDDAHVDVLPLIASYSRTGQNDWRSWLFLPGPVGFDR